MVVLPDPDSPISATTSPRAMVKPTSLTMMLSPRAVTHKPATSTRVGPSALIAGTAPRRQIVDQQVHRNRQRGDRHRWHDDGGGAVDQPFQIFAHERTPVGIRRLDAEPEERQAAQ